MPDFPHVVVFAVNLCLLSLASLSALSRMRLGGAASVLALWLVATGQIVAMTEILSLAHAIGETGYLLGQLAITGGAVALLRGRDYPTPAQIWARLRTATTAFFGNTWDWRSPALPALALGCIVTGLLATVLAVWVPPNSWDGLAYHLSRVGFYLQFRSLDHYPAGDLRQVVFPANGEILMLWTAALLRSDRLVALVQIVAWVVAVVGVYGLARMCCFGPRMAWFAAAAFALLPEVVLQATSTLNDLVLTSFVLCAVFFAITATRTPRPTAALALAGAALGLAIGTKGIGLLAVPLVGMVFIALRGRLTLAGVIGGVALGSLLVFCLGSYVYLQNWYYYGSPTASLMRFQFAGAPVGPLGSSRSPLLPADSFTASLARNLYADVFADLSGPLADPHLIGLSGPLVQALASAGERAFAALGVPSTLPGLDPEGFLRFTFVRRPRVNEAFSGAGPIGALSMLVALGVLVWPRRLPMVRRTLALAAVGFVILLSSTLQWNPWGARFLLISFALAAPLLGGLYTGHAAWRWAPLLLALWSAASGIYTVWFDENRPVAELGDKDSLAMMVGYGDPKTRAFFREVDQELGRDAKLGLSSEFDDWTYPFFGQSFRRTVIPLVEPGYAERFGLIRQLPWTNDRLIEVYPLDFVVLSGTQPGGKRLPDVIPGRCFQLPLRNAKPAVPWELWRCNDRDPRSLLVNGDFSSEASRFQTATTAQAGDSAEGIAWGWQLSAEGGGRLSVSSEPSEPGGEPFRVRLLNRGSDFDGEMWQQVRLRPELDAQLVVVDARLVASRPGAVLVRMTDGATVSEAANQSVEPETIRIVHRLEARAKDLHVALRVGPEATVRLRSILAIPRLADDQPDDARRRR